MTSTNKNAVNLPAGVTEKDLEQLIGNPGTVVSNLAEQPQVIRASSSVDINVPAGREIRPQLGGLTAADEKIGRPSPKLAQRLSEGHERNMAELAAERQKREEAAGMTFESMSKQINYLTRSLKKLQAEVNKLKGN